MMPFVASQVQLQWENDCVTQLQSQPKDCMSIELASSGTLQRMPHVCSAHNSCHQEHHYQQAFLGDRACHGTSHNHSEWLRASAVMKEKKRKEIKEKKRKEKKIRKKKKKKEKGGKKREEKRREEKRREERREEKRREESCDVT